MNTTAVKSHSFRVVGFRILFSLIFTFIHTVVYAVVFGHVLSTLSYCMCKTSLCGKRGMCLQYMSLMAELGQGPPPTTGGFTAGAASTGARPQIHQHQSRVNYPLTCMNHTDSPVSLAGN